MAFYSFEGPISAQQITSYMYAILYPALFCKRTDYIVKNILGSKCNNEKKKEKRIITQYDKESSNSNCRTKLVPRKKNRSVSFQRNKSDFCF